MPAAALGALALVVAAWFLPLGRLGEGEPPAQRPLPIAPGTDPNAELKGLPPYEIPEWTALEPALMALRDPVEKPIEAAIIEDPGSATTETVAPTPPPAPGFSVAWQYIGYIDDGTGLRAVVTTASMRQRLLREGETVTDETDPRAQEIKVVSITPQELRLEQRGSELTLQIVKTEPGAFTSADPRLAPNPRSTGQRPGVAPPSRNQPQRSREF